MYWGKRLLLTFLMNVQGCVIFIAFLKRIKNLEKLKNIDFSIHEYCFWEALTLGTNV